MVAGSVPNGGWGFGTVQWLGVRCCTVVDGSVLNNGWGFGGKPHGSSRELAVSALSELSSTTYI